MSVSKNNTDLMADIASNKDLAQPLTDRDIGKPERNKILDSTVSTTKEAEFSTDQKPLDEHVDKVLETSDIWMRHQTISMETWTRHNYTILLTVVAMFAAAMVAPIIKNVFFPSDPPTIIQPIAQPTELPKPSNPPTVTPGERTPNE